VAGFAGFSRRVGALCEQLAPIAETVTDAFAIPDALLRAPIAQR
jgi:hypothetical protein